MRTHPFEYFLGACLAAILICVVVITVFFTFQVVTGGLV